jgi:hypothetical protein
MAIAMRCDTCGAEAPSHGSLQMHQLRYHSSLSAPAAPPGPGVPAPTSSRGHGPAQPDRGPSQPRNRRSGAIAPLALAVVALLSGGAFAAIRSRAEAPAPAEAPATVAELQAAVHRAVLTAGDLPAGWTAAPSDSSDNGADESDRVLAECMGATYEDSPTEAESTFSSAGLSAGSDFTIASSLERARGDFTALAGPAAPGCFEQMFRKQLDADKPAGDSYDVKVSPSDLAAGLVRDADRDAVGLRMTASLHRGKVTVPMIIDVIMLRYDRIETTLTFTSVGDAAFPGDLARSLTNTVVQRLANPA